VPVIFRDIETHATLQLRDCGAWKYAGDESTGVWCVGYAVDAEPVQAWLPGQLIPEVFQIAATDPAWIVVAHNDAFERAVEERLLAPRYNWPLVPIERHRCTMAMALAAALPAKLEAVAAALGLPSKDTEGARLMLQMSKPRKPRPGEDSAGVYWIDDHAKLKRLIDVKLPNHLFGIGQRLQALEKRALDFDILRTVIGSLSRAGDPCQDAAFRPPSSRH
jgi:DNA polymerase